METTRWKIQDSERIDGQAIEEAAAVLKRGGTVAFPTETVYGLGADATNEEAVSGIFQAKGRPQDNPLIAHIADREQLYELVERPFPYVDMLLDAFTPGPLTFVLPSNGTCAANVTAGLPTLGVRIPDHPVAQQLLRACRLPIAAPSANLSGKPSPTTADHVWADLHGRISGLVDGGATGVGLESTVLDCTQEIPIILRPGGITREQLESVIGNVMVDPALAGKDDRPKAPGMKYRHYSPEVPLWLVEGNVQALQDLIDQEKQKGQRIGLLAGTRTAKQLEADAKIELGGDIAEIAANLYDGLRTFKEGDIDLIICEAFAQEGLGQAVMNRLKKAASDYLQLG
ncbi:L-threonylcarbamoyladenylate synthase [Virgibacillus xinjiangensis]|uniref:Threonylcarbamoyl-AMP synthase n=1 Tax=Virgibacillus xinjiangensis TaxID=393090 RepID=A0ABV7CT44_9BACI